MGRAAPLVLCSLLCLVAATCTCCGAFVSPTMGGPLKALKTGATAASPVIQQRASTQGVSLAAPLCLLAVAWVARSSTKKPGPVKRPVVILSASMRSPDCVAASTELISFEEELGTIAVDDSTACSSTEAEPQVPAPVAGRSHRKRSTSSRTQRRSIGAKLARPAELPVALEPSYDISKVRSKLQSGLCGHGFARTACRSREVRSASTATAQGIVVYSCSRFSIFSVVHDSEGS